MTASTKKISKKVSPSTVVIVVGRLAAFAIKQGVSSVLRPLLQKFILEQIGRLTIKQGQVYFLTRRQRWIRLGDVDDIPSLDYLGVKDSSATNNP